MQLTELRQTYHRNVVESILSLDETGTPNNADKSSKSSTRIARGIFERLPHAATLETPLVGQTVGKVFEQVNQRFLEATLQRIHHLRPGEWMYDLTGDIAQFEQYAHLADLSRILDLNPNLKSALGTDYLITPDVIMARRPLDDTQINGSSDFISDDAPIALHTPLRQQNRQSATYLLHASISVKWTLRSDRAQNARTEALNLIRNRKGHTPRIVVITAEPSPGRLASLALGTGDLDCVYHFALYELQDAVQQNEGDDTIDLLNTMVQGNRLRDISDLPFDLVI